MIAAIVSQLFGLLGAIPGLVSIQLTTELSQELEQMFSRLLPALFIISQIILMAYIWWNTPNARKRLSEWNTSKLAADEMRELVAWKEITNLVTQYVQNQNSGVRYRTFYAKRTR